MERVDEDHLHLFKRVELVKKLQYHLPNTRTAWKQRVEVVTLPIETCDVKASQAADGGKAGYLSGNVPHLQQSGHTGR